MEEGYEHGVSQEGGSGQSGATSILDQKIEEAHEERRKEQAEQVAEAALKDRIYTVFFNTPSSPEQHTPDQIGAQQLASIKDSEEYRAYCKALEIEELSDDQIKNLIQSQEEYAEKVQQQQYTGETT